MVFEVSGFNVWGLVFSFSGFGVSRFRVFEVQGFEYGVSRFRVWGLEVHGFRGLGFWARGFAVRGFRG